MMIDSNVIFGKWKYTNEDYSIDKISILLEKHNIDKALVISTKGIFYDDETGNDETLAICKEHKHLYPVGTIDLGKFLNVEEEVAARKEQGFKAFRLFNEYQQVDFRGLRFKKVMKILERYSMPLIVRGTDLNLKSYVDEIAACTSGFDVPVIVLDVSGYSLSEIIEAAKFAPNLNFSTRLFTTLQSIELFCEEVSSRRLVMGSGMPFYYGHQSLYRIKTAHISEEIKEEILFKNLSRLLVLQA